MRILFAVALLLFSQISFAFNQAAEDSCPGCHSVSIDGVLAVGNGTTPRNCAQRSYADWIITIDRMNGKNCGANDVAGIANYLANFSTLGSTTTTTTTSVTTSTTVSTTTTTTSSIKGLENQPLQDVVFWISLTMIWATGFRT